MVNVSGSNRFAASSFSEFLIGDAFLCTPTIENHMSGKGARITKNFFEVHIGP